MQHIDLFYSSCFFICFLRPKIGDVVLCMDFIIFFRVYFKLDPLYYRMSHERLCLQVFVLHLQLESYMVRGTLLEHPLPSTMQSSVAGSGQIHASDVSSASFGSEVSLG